MSLPVLSQVRVSGRVFDITQRKPLDGVSVLSTSGGGTSTDVNGRYTIIVNEKDSIWFSYLGKPTPKVAVLAIPNTQNFETALHVNIASLKEVVVMPRNYRVDSLQNRADYARAFNFRRPNLETLTSITPSGAVGLDINEFIRMFQFGRNRRMAGFQERLLREETEKYIDHRFNRPLIIKLTQLRGPELDTFISWYRPTVEFTESTTEYEFQAYIKRSFLSYQRFRRMMGEGKKED
ncbi:MAG: carboxypeptidase-like regulatory domain-containing protein [Chitinophagaceae bacterium]|nr:carboxypeptidase-like regulatory domain-containing protein [Chitinophagaceae bacterium]